MLQQLKEKLRGGVPEDNHAALGREQAGFQHTDRQQIFMEGGVAILPVGNRGATKRNAVPGSAGNEILTGRRNAEKISDPAQGLTL